MRFLPRRLRSFSLRTLLVAFTMLCMALGWVASERHIVQRRKRMRDVLAPFVLFADTDDYFPFFPFEDPDPPKRRATVSWIRELFGDEPVQQLWVPYDCKPWHLAMAARCFPEAEDVDWYASGGKVSYVCVAPSWYKSKDDTQARFLPSDAYVPLENQRHPRFLGHASLTHKRPPPSKAPPLGHRDLLFWPMHPWDRRLTP
ncbi:MAG: hypothetical protein U0836_11075 [Pirellulales bacterium]